MTFYDYQIGQKPYSKTDDLVEPAPSLTPGIDAAIEGYDQQNKQEAQPVIDQLKLDHPGMPSDDIYDYYQMISDGKTPKPSDDGQGVSFLPDEYYKGGVKPRFGYDVTSNSYQAHGSFDRTALKASRDIMQGTFETLLYGPYAAGRALSETAVELGVGEVMDFYQTLSGKEKVSRNLDELWDEKRDEWFDRHNNPPELPEARLASTDTVQGMVEEISSDVLTILGDIGIGNKLLGVTKINPVKAAKSINRLIDTIKNTISKERGVALGEIMYSKGGMPGNLSTMLQEFGIGGDLTEYLDSTQFDTETEMAMKNVLEGVIVSKALQVGWAAGSKGIPELYKYMREYQPKAQGSPGTQKGMVALYSSDGSEISPDIIASIMDEDKWFDRGLKIGKETKIYRGKSVSRNGSGGATHGRGLYTTTDKAQAKEFGDVSVMSVDDLPKSPIRFRDQMAYQNWKDNMRDALGYKRASELENRFKGDDEIIRAIDPTIDGVQIGEGHGAFFVKFPKEKVK